MSKVNLKNKWALVTGASSGIGKSLAVQLAQNGCNVVCTARRKERLDQLKQELEKNYSVKVETISCDLIQPEGAKMLFDEIKQKQIPVSILVNNAGRGHFGGFDQFSLKEHRDDIELNIRALTTLCYLFIDSFKKHKEKSYILNVASVVSYVTLPNYAVYSATKRFVRHFSCLLYTSPSPRDRQKSRMPSSA